MTGHLEEKGKANVRSKLLTDTEKEIRIRNIHRFGGIPISDAYFPLLVIIDSEAKQRKKCKERSNRPKQEYRSPYHFIGHMLRINGKGKKATGKAL